MEVQLVPRQRTMRWYLQATGDKDCWDVVTYLRGCTFNKCNILDQSSRNCSLSSPSSLKIFPIYQVRRDQGCVMTQTFCLSATIRYSGVCKVQWISEFDPINDYTPFLITWAESSITITTSPNPLCLFWDLVLRPFLVTQDLLFIRRTNCQQQGNRFYSELQFLLSCNIFYWKKQLLSKSYTK